MDQKRAALDKIKATQAKLRIAKVKAKQDVERLAALDKYDTEMDQLQVRHTTSIWKPSIAVGAKTLEYVTEFPHFAHFPLFSNRVHFLMLLDPLCYHTFVIIMAS